MADSTIDSENIKLKSNWPNGYSLSHQQTPPLDGFTGSEHHNVATAKFPLGTMIRVYNRSADAGVDGWSTFIYGQTKDTIAAAKEVCQPALAGSPYAVSSTVASAIQANDLSNLCMVSISAMTDEYYGWFYCDGVVPEAYVSALGGNYPTDGNLIIGVFGVGAGAGANGVFEPADGTGLAGYCGYSDAADA